LVCRNCRNEPSAGSCRSSPLRPPADACLARIPIPCLRWVGEKGAQSGPQASSANGRWRHGPVGACLSPGAAGWPPHADGGGHSAYVLASPTAFPLGRTSIGGSWSSDAGVLPANWPTAGPGGRTGRPALQRVQNVDRRLSGSVQPSGTVETLGNVGWWLRKMQRWRGLNGCQSKWSRR